MKKEPEEIDTSKMKLFGEPVREKPKKLKCPVCKLSDTYDASVRGSNGVYGPGRSSWVQFEAWCCNKCGAMFREVKPKKTT